MANASGGNAYVPGASYGIAALEISNATESNTRHLQAGIARVLANKGDSRLAFVGDSTTFGSYAVAQTAGGSTNAKTSAMPAQLAKLLTARGLPASDDSWFGTYALGNAAGLNTGYPAITIGTGFSAALSIISGSAWLSTSSGSTISFQPAGVFDTIDFYTINGGAFGSFTVNVDGGSTIATVSCVGTNTVTRTTVTGVARGTHTINIATTSTASVYVIGIAGRDSTISKILTNNLGIIASTAASWAAINASNYGYVPAMAALTPDCTFINLTINDIVNNTESISTYTANLQTLINGALAAGGDVVLMVGNPGLNANFGNSIGQSFIAAVHSLAVSNGLPCIDLMTKWVSYAVSAPLGYYGDSNEHPISTGYADIATSVAKLCSLM